MKKILALTILVAAFSLLPSQSASAQYFDHLALGVNVGVDGFGIQLAAPIGGQFQMRAGYSILPPLWKPHKVFNVKPSNNDDPVDVDIEAIVLFHNANLMFDWHPAGKGFFFTVGAYAGPSTAFKAHNKQPFLDEEDWGTVGIKIGESTMATTDAKGIVTAKMKVWPVRPYVGFGYGTPVKADKRVGWNIELGTCFTGGYKLYVSGRDMYEGGEISDVRVTSADLVNDDGEMQDKGIVDKMAKFPILPMLKFGVFFRLF
ncbi:MAG: hypothetical protein J6T02_05530 [Bacteroidales bacterium]|nr:hypothetical protein [Bacteroidales bacterium]